MEIFVRVLLMEYWIELITGGTILRPDLNRETIKKAMMTNKAMNLADARITVVDCM